MKFIIGATGTTNLRPKYGKALEKRNWIKNYRDGEIKVETVKSTKTIEIVNITETIEIVDLEDLIEFQKEIDEELIIGRESDTELPTIEIYDDCRE